MLLRDRAALETRLLWHDYDTWETWPAEWWNARVRVAWMGVIGHTGMGLTRRVLYFQGSSRKNVIDQCATYESITEHGIGAACAPTETLHPPTFFAGGAFAYDQRSLVPPFPPSGRGEEAVFSAILSRLDDATLMRAVPVMVWHEPVQTRSHSSSIVDARLRVNHLLSSLISEAPLSDRALAPCERMIEIGRYIESFASQPSHAFVHAVADRISRQLAETWAQLFQLRTEHDGPEWWRRDVEATSLRIRQLIAARLSAEQQCRLGLIEPLETAVARIRQYGQILQAWPSMWASRRQAAEPLPKQRLQREKHSGVQSGLVAIES